MAKEDISLRLSLIDGVSRSIADIRKSVNDLGASIVKVNAAADLTKKAFDGISKAGGFLADQITSVGAFEDSLASLQAVTGASAGELEKLRNAAVAASQASIFSSTQAADGLTELARAGFDAAGAISALNPVLALAQGQQLSVGESAQFVTTTLTQFGLAAGEAARVADVLASTADKSSVDVRQLGQALSYAAPIAKQVGLDLEETTAIIGKLADEGFRGERGGTALANVFTALIDPSSKFSKALDGAGIKTRDFAEVMDALAAKGKDAGSILLELDTTARPAITALASKGSAGIRELNKALDESTGAAQRTADIMGGTFNSVVKKFQNNIANLRDAVVAPILTPIADEITRVSDRLIAFSQSGEFDALIENFTRVATAGVKGFGDFIASVDFTEATVRLVDFSTSVAENLEVIAKAFDYTGRTIGGFSDLVSISFNSIKGVSASVAAALIEPLAVFDEGANGIWISLRAQAAESEKSVGQSLEKLGGRFTGTASSASRLRDILNSGSDASRVAAQRYSALAESLIPAPFLAVAKAAQGAVAELRELVLVPEPARLSLGKLAETADIAGLSISALEERLKAVREALNNAPQGSAGFASLAKDAANLEIEISKAKDSIKVIGDEIKGAGEKADKASSGMRNFASAARDAGNAAEKSAGSNSQVAESFGNIGKQAAAAKADMGNMSKALLDLAISLQSQARNGREIIEIWKGITDQYNQSNERIEYAIQLRKRQLGVIDEEEQVRKRLQQQYGTDSTLLEELVQIELKRLAIQKERVAESQKELEVQKEILGLAGGFGPSRSATDSSAGATGGRGSSTGTGSRDAQITVNVQGMTDEQAREFVQRTVVPEIERIQRLSR